MKNMNSINSIGMSKPSIVKDAFYGLLSATLIGVLSSLTFILVVLFLSSQAFASS